MHIWFNSSVTDDSGVSVATLHSGANSGQTSIKSRDLACDVGTTAVRKLHRFDHEIGNERPFFQLHLQVQIFLFVSCLKVWK